MSNIIPHLIIWWAVLMVAIYSAQAHGDQPHGNEHSLMVEMSFTQDGNNITFINITKIEGNPPRNYLEPSDGYSAQLLDGRTLLFQRKFVLDSVLHEPKPEWFNDDGEQIVVPEETEVFPTEVVLVIPYFEEADMLRVLHPDGFSLIDVIMREKDDKTLEYTIFASIFVAMLVASIVYVYFRRQKRLSKK